MRTEEDLFEKLREAIVEVLNMEEAEVKPESMLKADLKAESIDLLDVSFELEKLIGREIDFKEVVQFVNNKKGSEVDDISLSDVVDYMKATEN